MVTSDPGRAAAATAMNAADEMSPATVKFMAREPLAAPQAIDRPGDRSAYGSVRLQVAPNADRARSV